MTLILLDILSLRTCGELAPSPLRQQEIFAILNLLVVSITHLKTKIKLSYVLIFPKFK